MLHKHLAGYCGAIHQPILRLGSILANRIKLRVSDWRRKHCVGTTQEGRCISLSRHSKCGPLTIQYKNTKWNSLLLISWQGSVNPKSICNPFTDEEILDTYLVTGYWLLFKRVMEFRLLASFLAQIRDCYMGSIWSFSVFLDTLYQQDDPSPKIDMNERSNQGFMRGLVN